MDCGIEMHGADVGPVEDPLGQPVAGLMRGGLVDRDTIDADLHLVLVERFGELVFDDANG
jgi:hypothetical protein